jgi:hypothetical protein
LPCPPGRHSATRGARRQALKPPGVSSAHFWPSQSASPLQATGQRLSLDPVEVVVTPVSPWHPPVPPASASVTVVPLSTTFTFVEHARSATQAKQRGARSTTTSGYAGSGGAGEALTPSKSWSWQTWN